MSRPAPPPATPFAPVTAVPDGSLWEKRECQVATAKQGNVQKLLALYFELGPQGLLWEEAAPEDLEEAWREDEEEMTVHAHGREGTALPPKRQPTVSAVWAFWT